MLLECSWRGPLQAVRVWAQGDAAPGTLPADAASGARMAPAVTEAALYAQLAHFARLLDADAALARVRDEAEREVARRFREAVFSLCFRFRDPNLVPCVHALA